VKAVDTNVLVRYLVKDDAAQFDSAAAFFGGMRADGVAVRVDAIVLCELVWVLRSSYDYSRTELAVVIEKILSTEQLEVEDADSAWLALDDFRTSKADYADCFIGRRNQRVGCEVTVTFDGRLKPLAAFELLPHSSSSS
jgi:predicted nucleic-acid-binding protein